MSTPILRRFPFVLALVAALWCVWIGVPLWTSLSDMSVLGPLLLVIPILLAAGAALISRLRAPGFLASVVGLFLGYVFITGFSIGGAYHGPAALLGVALLVDIAFSWRDTRGTHRRGLATQLRPPESELPGRRDRRHLNRDTPSRRR